MGVSPDKASDLHTPAQGRGTFSVSLWWGHVLASPGLGTELMSVPVWGLEEFGPVTLMHRVLLCGHRPVFQ